MMDPLTRAVKPIAHRQIRKPLSQEVRHAYHTLVFTLGILGIGTLMSFLYTNSLKPVKGYELEKLQAESENLQSQLRKLNQKVIEAQSFVNIDESERLEDMEKLNDGSTSYLDESNVAQNQPNSNPDRTTQ
jgi:uncharacterized protein YlxW (UPF0749 family)